MNFASQEPVTFRMVIFLAAVYCDQPFDVWAKITGLSTLLNIFFNHIYLTRLPWGFGLQTTQARSLVSVPHDCNSSYFFMHSEVN